MTALRFDDVRFDYGAGPVLRGVAFTLEQGDTMALLGPNGAGKTTLTKLVVGLLHPKSGGVWVGGRTTQGRTPEQMARQAAYVFQHPDQQLFARSVAAEVAFSPRLRGLHEDETRELVRDVLTRTGLESVSEEHPYDLPPAQRKLVALAAALAQQPQVLVLDEPAQGLDRAGISRVTAIVREVAAEGVAVLAVTHDLAFALETLERSLVLVEGEVEYDGRSQDLFQDETRLGQLGLEPSQVARLSRELDLPGRPVRVDEVANAIARLAAP